MSRRGKSPRRHHTVTLTDQVWDAVSRQAIEEGRSVSDVAEYVVQDYLRQETRLVYQVPQGLPVSKHTVRISDDVWKHLLLLKLDQDRDVSTILEQQLRLYLLMDLGELQNEIPE